MKSISVSTLKARMNSESPYRIWWYYVVELSGEYPNFSALTFVQLKQIQNFVEDQFVIKSSQFTCRIEIIAFLHAQWKIYHENIIKTSTPDFKSTYQHMVDYPARKPCILSVRIDCNSCRGNSSVLRGLWSSIRSSLFMSEIWIIFLSEVKKNKEIRTIL
jgi:hypothetical protein